jgi:hypothetical protein
MLRARLWTCRMFFHSHAQTAINPPASSVAISRLTFIHSAFFSISPYILQLIQSLFSFTATFQYG